MTALTALVQSALCAGLVRAASERGYHCEARRIASWARAYGRTAGLSVPMPAPRLFETEDSIEKVRS